MRLLLRGVAALLLLVLLALGALWWRMDALAQRAIERGASEALGVRTEVRSLLLEPFSGVVSVRGLEIANPPGYPGTFLAAERARAELDPRTLRRDVIDVTEVSLSGVAVTLEERREGTNYDAIVGHLERPSDAPKPSSGPQLRVRDLFVRDVTAHLRVGDAPDLRLQVPEIHLRNLGGPGGTTTGEISVEVVRAVLTSVATRVPGVPLAVASRLLGGLGVSRAADTLRDLGERGSAAIRGLFERH